MSDWSWNTKACRRHMLCACVLPLFAAALLAPAAMAAPPDRTDQLLADLFWPKSKQFGPFRVILKSNPKDEAEERKAFIYARVFAQLFNELAHNKLKCGTILTPRYEVDGFWLRKPRDELLETNREVCISDLSYWLLAYKPAISDVKRALLNIVEKDRKRLGQIKARETPEAERQSMLKALRGLLPNAQSSIDAMAKKDGITVERERLEQARAAHSAMLALSQLLRRDWPGRLWLSLTATDFQTVDKEDFLAWLRRLRAENGIVLDTKLEAGVPERPWESAAPFDPKVDTANVVEVKAAEGLAQGLFLLNFLADRNAAEQPKPEICKDARAAMPDASPLAQSAKCTFVDIHPGIELVVVYLPGELGTGQPALAALREIAAHPSLVRLRAEGTKYGLPSAVVVNSR